ncbi:MAG: DUF5691 domain-containing protein [Micromonosporaceae bacterium]
MTNDTLATAPRAAPRATSWAELLAAALVGTDRRGGAADAAGALLDAAAVHSVYRRAGRMPAIDLPAPASAPAEVAAVVSAAAGERLATFVDPNLGADATIRTALLAEWLDLAARAGRRVPPELLPELLELGRRHRELRPLIVAAGGARLAWFGAQNPEWTYILITPDATGSTDETHWLEGTRGQRVGYLTAVRAADPDGARDRLGAEWPSLSPDERAELLPVLATGLGPGDEEFLEGALDDRRREVRVTAAELLAALPGSAYRVRMAQRAHACVRVRAGRLLVRPPVECDPAMRRDGIVPKAPTGAGERAWWLEQVLARAPLDTWATDDPASFLRCSIEDGWEVIVLRGLARAAATQRDPAWSAALLDVLEPRVAADPQPRVSSPASVQRWPIADLYPALTAEERARRAAAALGDENARLGRLVEHVLEHCPAPWPDALARAVLTGLPVHARRPRMPYDLYRVSRIAALRMPSHFAAEAAAVAGRSERAEVFERLATILDLRHEMTQELA